MFFRHSPTQWKRAWISSEDFEWIILKEVLLKTEKRWNNFTDWLTGIITSYHFVYLPSFSIECVGTWLLDNHTFVYLIDRYLCLNLCIFIWSASVHKWNTPKHNKNKFFYTGYFQLLKMTEIVGSWVGV